MRLMGVRNLVLALLVLCLTPWAVTAQELQPLSISLEGYDYPYKVDFLALNQEGQDLKMAYMDVKPQGKANGKTVLLLHGKNFPGAYWQDTIRPYRTMASGWWCRTRSASANPPSPIFIIAST